MNSKALVGMNQRASLLGSRPEIAGPHTPANATHHGTNGAMSESITLHHLRGPSFRVPQFCRISGTEHSHTPANSTHPAARRKARISQTPKLGSLTDS